MKLMIDLTEKDYKFIKGLQSLIIGGRGNCKTIQKNVINAIKNGTPYNPSGDSISRKWVKNNVLSLIDPETRYYVKQKIDSAPSVCGNNPNWCESCVSKGKCASTNLKGGKEE